MPEFVVSKGWPDNWDDRVSGRACAVCEQRDEKDNATGVHVFDGKFAKVHLVRRAHYPGHCVVTWKQPHATDLAALSSEDAAGYWLEVLAVGRAVQKVFSPVRVNYMNIANVYPHIHSHVVPRYLDDPVPQEPPSWKVAFLGEPIDEDVLRRNAQDLNRLLTASRPR